MVDYTFFDELCQFKINEQPEPILYNILQIDDKEK